MKSRDSKWRLGYLGPRGTFSDQAAQAYIGRASLLPFDSFAQIVSALQAGEVDKVLLPIENSTEGPVNETVDALIRNEDLEIVAEQLIAVEQNLIGVNDAQIDRIEAVVSIPIVHAQVKRWLESHLPNAKKLPAPSTARAVESLTDAHPEIAAIGTRIAAEIYGRRLLAIGVQDNHDNVTRFVLAEQASTTRPPITGEDRTTLILGVHDRPGSLVTALSVFDVLDVNMSKIESRPRGVFGHGHAARTGATYREAIFHIDIEGHRDDPVIKVALEALARKCDYLRVAGSYPKAPWPIAN